MKIPNKIGLAIIAAAILGGAALYGFFYFSLDDLGAYPSLSVNSHTF